MAGLFRRDATPKALPRSGSGTAEPSEQPPKVAEGVKTSIIEPSVLGDAELSLRLLGSPKLQAREGLGSRSGLAWSVDFPQ